MPGGIFRDGGGGGGGGGRTGDPFDWSNMGGSNQWGNFPAMGSSPGSLPAIPGIVPQQGSSFGPSTFSSIDPGGINLPGREHTVPPLDPAFTSAFYNFLQSHLGKGVTPFNLSAILPSTGQATAPGTLTAPLNPLEESLNKFYAGQGGGPDSFILPMWESQLAAMQQPIQQNLANMREQFASQGALGSSEFGNAIQNYMTQTTLQQQALLGEETLQALPGMQQQAGAIQGFDQASINNLLQEFIRTSPEYSPLLGYASQAAGTFPPFYGRGGSGIGTALAGSSGQILQGVAALVDVFKKP
jgi:hypothetical protein